MHGLDEKASFVHVSDACQMKS